MAHRMPIKLKAAAVASVPLVILGPLAALEVAQSAREVRDVEEQADLAAASSGPSGVITAVMNERNLTSLWLFGVEDSVDLPVDTLEEARADTDAAITAFRDEVERWGGEAERRYAPALEALGGLDDHRDAVDGYDGERNIVVENETGEEVWAAYSRIVTALTDPAATLAYAIEDDRLRQGVQLVELASRQVDQVAQVVRMTAVAGVAGGGSEISDRGDFSEAVMLGTRSQRLHQEIIDLSTGPYAELGEELRAESEDDDQIFALIDEMVATREVEIGAMLDAVSIGPDESYYGFRQDVTGVVRARAGDLTAAAATRQQWTLALAGGIVALAALLTPLVARSITRALRSLTREARDMAERRLPEAVRSIHETPLGEDVAVPPLDPVRVRTRDEVAAVAAVLSTVQETARDLAVEQAVLRRNAADIYVNLARAFHELLGHQLAGITALEASETRSHVLADLYVLDHQATRMRRNAESLLVLAGADPRRHADSPASMNDVVRAALGEVAHYERVTIKGIQPAVVDGPAVADLAHLLAELIDNALTFSPPHELVEVRGHGRDDGYALAVIDRGLGMSAGDLARANRRLAHAEAHTTAPSSYLGHYVTAALATRHGMSVTLRSSLPTGIAATVDLPAHVLVAEPTAWPAGPVPASPTDTAPPAVDVAARPDGGAGAGPGDAAVPSVVERRPARPAPEVPARGASGGGASGGGASGSEALGVRPGVAPVEPGVPGPLRSARSPGGAPVTPAPGSADAAPARSQDDAAEASSRPARRRLLAAPGRRNGTGS